MDKVQLAVGGDDQVSTRTASASQLNVHVTGNARRTVGDSNCGVSSRHNTLSGVATNGLFNQGTEIGIGVLTPRSGELAVSG